MGACYAPLQDRPRVLKKVFHFALLCPTQLGNLGTPWDSWATKWDRPPRRLSAGRLGRSLGVSIVRMFVIVDGYEQNSRAI